MVQSMASQRFMTEQLSNNKRTETFLKSPNELVLSQDLGSFFFFYACKGVDSLKVEVPRFRLCVCVCVHGQIVVTVCHS